MEAIEALINRVSIPRVGSELPDDSELEIIFKAALRAPDHAQLRPWRFLTISGDDLFSLGELFLEAQLQDDAALSNVAQVKVKSKVLRAPLIVVAIASLQKHPKVPEIEQMLSAGAAVQNMLIAAYAQHIGAIWRTGSMAYHPVVRDGLGVCEDEKIIGYIYMGKGESKARVPTDLVVEDYVSQWKIV